MKIFNVLSAGAIVAAMLANVPAKAQAPQSIPWFEQDEHAGAREKAITLCRNDYRYYKNSETSWVCENAEIAENRVYLRNKNLGLKAVDTVRWWKNNEYLRRSTLIACKRRAPYDRESLRYCDVANRAQNEMN